MPKITLEGYECNRCGHKWVARGKRYPKMCPKCKSVNWDEPKQRESTK